MQKELVLDYKGEELQGILVKEDKNFMTLKLKSGYNVNLIKSETNIVSKKDIEISKNEISKIKQNNDLPKIAIIHTGGTIASKVDYRTGAVSSKFTPEELLNMYPELQDKVQIDIEMIGNIFSEDMNFSHWNLILDSISRLVKNKPRGIIVSHGTDTLSYTAQALQYAIKGLEIPIIIVGAQRSSDRPSSDAYTNLGAAINFILDEKIKYFRVGICMHSQINDEEFVIYDSINVKKMHSSRRDAFKQINYSPVALIKDDKIKILREFEIIKENFSILKYDEKLKIGFFKSHPGLFPQEILDLKKYEGVIIEGTGLGHLAVNCEDEYTSINLENFKALKELAKGTKVIMGVQTVYGQTNMNVYSTGRYIQEAGVLGNYMNLITDCLFVRLAYCLSKDKNNFDELWNSNLEGFEIRSTDVELDF